MITEDYVRERYHAILSDLTANILPISQWAKKPKNIGFTTHKTKYGLATFKGEVLINRNFIGTTAKRKLDHTIRHELAHFAVGFKHHHNKVFKRCEVMFGNDPDLDLSDEQINSIEKTIEITIILIFFLNS